MAGRIKPRYKMVVNMFVLLKKVPFRYRTSGPHCIHQEPEVRNAFKMTLEVLGNRLINSHIKPIFKKFPTFMGLATVPPVGPYPMTSFTVWNPAKHQYVWEHFCDGPVLDFNERELYMKDELFEESLNTHLDYWMEEFGTWIAPEYDQDDEGCGSGCSPPPAKRSRLSLCGGGGCGQVDLDSSVEIVYEDLLVSTFSSPGR